MKVVTIEQFEANIEAIIDDVSENGQYYRIQSAGGDLIVVPHREYEVLKEVYQEWVEDPTIDPNPLPVQYIGDAEPEDLNVGSN